MGIELKEAAQQALKELGEARKIVRASSSRQLAKDWDRRATDALANLRNAIQQAEAQQPATGEPVAWIRRHPNGALSNELLIHVQVEQVRRDSGAWVPLYTHQAPSVPDDVVRNAKRYEWLRYADLDAAAAKFWPEGVVPEGDAFDAAIDAAMLAAK